MGGLFVVSNVQLFGMAGGGVDDHVLSHFPCGIHFRVWCQHPPSLSRQVGIPHDCLAVQLGEAAEVVSGGRLRATRHMVRGPRVDKAQGISRNTFAVFMQPRCE